MIAGNLEYVMCSLPYLSFQDTNEERHRVNSLFADYANPSDKDWNAVSILEEEAKKFLSAKHFQIFKEIRLENIHTPVFRNSNHLVIAAFSKFTYELKKSVEKLRIARSDGRLASSAQTQDLALDPGSPLEEEIQLLNLQWQRLEDISMEHHADLGALFIYKLKLMLLMRWWSFDQKLGFEKFLKITTEN